MGAGCWIYSSTSSHRELLPELKRPLKQPCKDNFHWLLTAGQRMKADPNQWYVRWPIHVLQESSVNLLTGSYVHPEDFLKRSKFIPKITKTPLGGEAFYIQNFSRGQNFLGILDTLSIRLNSFLTLFPNLVTIPFWEVKQIPNSLLTFLFGPKRNLFYFLASFSSD